MGYPWCTRWGEKGGVEHKTACPAGSDRLLALVYASTASAVLAVLG
jgi:hypothetical protein